MKNRHQVIRILKVAFPLMIAQLFSMSMGTVDTVMAGNYSADALAAVAMGANIYFPIMLFFGGILFSLTPIMAFHSGGEHYKEIGRELRQSLWLFFILAFFGILFCRNTYYLCYLFKTDPDLIPTIKGYLNAVSFGIPGIMLFFIFKSPFEALTRVRTITLWNFIGLLTNIGANYLFVYGKLGFPEMGAVGTGYATALTCWVMFFGIFIMSIYDKRIATTHLFSSFDRPDLKMILNIMKIGLPIAISVALEVLMFATVAFLAGMFGKMQLAGNQVAFNITGLTFVFPLGLSFALTSLVGNAYGKGDYELIKRIGIIGNIIAGLFMAVSACSIYTFRYEIASLYTNEQEIINLVGTLLVYGAFFQVFDGIQVSSVGNLRGVQDTKMPMFIGTFCYWFLGLGIAYTAAVHLKMEVKGLWIGIIIGLGTSAILHTLRFFFVIKRLQKSLPAHCKI